MDDLKDIPHIPPMLLKWLRAGHPKRDWVPGMVTIESVMFEAGQQDIINKLQDLKDQQEEETED